MTDLYNNTASIEDVPEPPKKKRGRPRKNPVPKEPKERKPRKKGPRPNCELTYLDKHREDDTIITIPYPTSWVNELGLPKEVMGVALFKMTPTLLGIAHYSKSPDTGQIFWGKRILIVPRGVQYNYDVVSIHEFNIDAVINALKDAKDRWFGGQKVEEKLAEVKEKEQDDKLDCLIKKVKFF